MTALLDAFILAAMMILMFSLGLRLSLSEIMTEFRHPRALLIGLGVQVVGVPLLAWMVGTAALLTPAMFAGLMLVAASPGGLGSNYATMLMRGKVGLSVSMTTLTILAAPVTMPLVLWLSGAAVLDGAGLWRLSLGMIAGALIPMGAAMALRRLLPRVTLALSRPLEPLARSLFLLMIAATVVRNRDAMTNAFPQLGLPVLMLAICVPMLAASVAWVMNLTGPERRAVMSEASLQNVAISVFVASGLLDLPALAIPGLLYAVMMNFVILVMIGLTALRAGGFRHQPA